MTMGCIWQFSTARAEGASTEVEDAEFIVSPVSQYVTPTDKLVGIATTDTANKAIAAMQQSGVRHLVVADQVSADNRVSGSADIRGVISMQDVMSTVQKDERLSLQVWRRSSPASTTPSLR